MEGGDLSSRGCAFGAQDGASRAQRMAIDAVADATSERPLVGREFGSEEALRALLRVGSSYTDDVSGSNSGELASYVEGQVSLPEVGAKQEATE